MEIPVERAWLENLQRYGKELETELESLDLESTKELRLKGRIVRVLGYIESVEMILETPPLNS